MRVPSPPPDILELFKKLAETGNSEWILHVAERRIGPAVDGKYRHWQVLRHLAPPPGLTTEEWWLAIKLARKHFYQELPLRDKRGLPFVHGSGPMLPEMLHKIDMEAGGAIWSDQAVSESQMRDIYLFHSLVEEAITSSQLEGASTTRRVAKEMLRSRRTPSTKSEWMIYNNYQAMEFIRQIKKDPLTPEIVKELHRILTANTMEDAGAVGRFRRPDEQVHIVDNSHIHILHVPPEAGELEKRMRDMCDFANAVDKSGAFIHPVVRSILLHFWLAYDHPFVDGNGRTARALFYWSMARRGYWLSEYISISRIIQKAPARYVRAFLYTETDDNDTTYFILNQLRVILQAVDELHKYLIGKTEELGRTRQLLLGSGKFQAILNHRQLAVINHALSHPGYAYTIKGHQQSHQVTYQTARTDLLALADHGLLTVQKFSKQYVFVVPEDLNFRLQRVTGRENEA